MKKIVELRHIKFLDLESRIHMVYIAVVGIVDIVAVDIVAVGIEAVGIEAVAAALVAVDALVVDTVDIVVVVVEGNMVLQVVVDCMDSISVQPIQRVVESMVYAVYRRSLWIESMALVGWAFQCTS